MASTIKVTSDTIRSKKQSLESNNQKLKGQISNLDSYEAQLMSVWKGDAADAFNSVYKKDAVCYDKFYNLIKEYCTALDTIVKAYEQAEKKNIQIAKKR